MKIPHIIHICVFLAFMIGSTGIMMSERQEPIVTDMTAVRDLCDTLPLHPIEGIWRFPDDHINVLILRDKRIGATRSTSYSLYVVESEDTRLHTGDIVGKIIETPDPDKYKLSLFTKRIGGILSMPYDCVATLRSDNESMVIKTPKIKVKLNPLAFFSNFWRIARITVENPLTSLPAGLIRIYPS